MFFLLGLCKVPLKNRKQPLIFLLTNGKIMYLHIINFLQFKVIQVTVGTYFFRSLNTLDVL